jgi:hypothetical protein
MNTSKVMIFAALISANMIIWHEALGLAGVAIFLVALLLFISWRRGRKS